MKRLKCFLAAKAAATVISFFAFTFMLISIFSVGYMFYNDFYTRSLSGVEESVMGKIASKEAYNARYHFENGDIEKYYSDKNFLFNVTDSSDNKVISNYDGTAEYIARASVRKNSYVLTDKEGNIYDYSEVIYEDEDEYSNDDVYIIARSKDGTEVFEISDYQTIEVIIPKKMEFTDRVFIINSLIVNGYKMRYAMIFIFVCSLVLTVFTVGWLFCSVGYKKGTDGIYLNAFNRMPFDVLTVLVAGFIAACVMFISSVNDRRITIIAAVFSYTVLYFVAVLYLLSFAVRIKAKTVLKNTVIWRLLRRLKNLLSRLFRALNYTVKGIPVAAKAVLIAAAVNALLFFSAYLLRRSSAFAFVWIAISLIPTAAFIFYAVGFSKIRDGAKRIASGELDYKVDTVHLCGEVKEFAVDLNGISDGFSSALDEKLKSERFKTELITNVSHDIKTPLTSIINYVDLIKKEHIENEKIAEYIEVLERQSNRLKKLTEDLVEFSKAQSGSIKAELSECNAYVMLSQSVAEYSDKLSAAGIAPVLPENEKSVMIMADGRRLWRVFDNLLNNVVKYALSGTRLYIELSQRGDETDIIFKNISALPIEMNPEQLTERFVRGDRSRNTEGSGLGLSIAKSFTEIQGGKLSLSADGDLFKAVVTLKSAT